MKKILVTALLLGLTTNSVMAGTLEKVKKAGVLNCGVSGNLPGFSQKQKDGTMTGFDADYCRAVAAAVGVSNVNFVPLSSKERLPALSSNKIDLLSRTTTWTLSRDTDGYEFIGTIFYDGEGFMVPKTMKVGKPSNYEGQSFCVRDGTTTAKNLKKYFAPKGVFYNVKTYVDKKAVDNAYVTRDCDVYVLDASALASVRNSMKNPDDHRILDIRISKEPLSPVVREGDDEWADIARWTMFLMIALEEHNIGQNSLMKNGEFAKLSLSQKAFLKQLKEAAPQLKLDDAWAVRVIKSVGNYNDVFQRHLGKDSIYKMKRGMNQIWTAGGMLYAPPFL